MGSPSLCFSTGAEPLQGYETTANGLAFTMFLLGCNPEAEAKLVAEVRSPEGPFVLQQLSARLQRVWGGGQADPWGA